MPGPGLDTIDEAEIEAILSVFRERNFSRYRYDDEVEDGSASFTWRFERELEAVSGLRHCLGMNSCTSALLAGLWALGIGPGDEVIVPGYTFVAPIAAICYTGARPVLAEIDGTLTLDPEDVARRITPATRAILCVHMLGLQCDMPALADLANRHGLWLVEDCAQAGGGRLDGRFLGAFGTFGAMSLNVFKTMTAGDGGVFMTDDDALFERVFAIHDHGARPFRKGVAEADGLLGLNLRMHELTGAMAWAQRLKLDGNLALLRERKAQVIAAIGPLRQARVIEARDPDGECATVLPVLFDSAERAAEVGNALGSKTLIQSGKHHYANIPQLRHRAVPAAIGSSGPANAMPAGMLPRTDDLLARTVALSIGVRDSYLGTGFGIGIKSSDLEIAETVERFRSALGVSACRC